MSESLSVLRVLLAAEPPHCTAQTAERLLTHIEGRPAVVTVVGVAAPPGRFESWAASTGYVDLKELRAAAVKVACAQARRLTEVLPPGVAAVHRALPSWKVLAREATDYDLVVRGGLPSRRRDRRLLPGAVLT